MLALRICVLRLNFSSAGKHGITSYKKIILQALAFFHASRVVKSLLRIIRNHNVFNSMGFLQSPVPDPIFPIPIFLYSLFLSIPYTLIPYSSIPYSLFPIPLYPIPLYLIPLFPIPLPQHASNTSPTQPLPPSVPAPGLLHYPPEYDIHPTRGTCRPCWRSR